MRETQGMNTPIIGTFNLLGKIKILFIYKFKSIEEMKKQLINGLLILAMFIVGVGTFSSCKDTNEDDLAKIEGTQSDLAKKLANLEDALAQIKSCSCNMEWLTESAWRDVQAKLSELDAAQKNYATKDELNQLRTDLENALKNYNSCKCNMDAINEQIKAIQDKLDNIKITNDKITINGTTYEGNDISNIINALNTYIQTVETSLNKCMTDCKESIAALKEQLGTKADAETVKKLEETINTLTNTITTIQSDITSLKEDVKKGIEALELVKEANKTIETLKETITKLETDYKAADTKLQEQIDSIKNNLQEQINSLTTKVTDLTKRLDTAEANITNLTTNVNNLNTSVTNLTTTVNNLTTTVDSLGKDIVTINTKLETLETNLDALTKRVEVNETAIKALQTEVDNLKGLTDRLNKLITGIIIQAVNNPAIGAVNLPLDVNSNILLAQYGYAKTNFTFPSNSSAAEYNNEIGFTAKDIEMLKASGNFQTLAVSNGECLLDGGEDGGNAGTVYLTINPNNVAFDGVKLSLVNSQDEESGIKISYVEKSNKVLTFGVSRSADNNGFYEAHAVLTEDNIEKAKVNVEPSLKTSLKNAVKERTVSNLENLAAALYTQFNGKFDAYGLKAGWTAQDGEGNTKEYATYSKYGIAAAAYTPLSFKFYYGQTTSDKLRLPIITPLSEYTFDTSKFTFNIDVPTFSASGIDVTFTLDSVRVNYEGEIDVYIKVPQFDADGKFIGYTTEKVHPTKESIEAFLKSVEDGVNASVTGWNESINTTFQNAINKLMAEVNDQVEKALNSIMGQVNDQIKDLVNDITSEIKGKLSRIDNYIDKYNQVAKKLNNMLANPNAYLQVMMCYKDLNSVYHQLSNSKEYPTVMKLYGGDAVDLLTTTYTAELFASAYKKFVGVTNVWNAETGASAQDGDATCLQLLKDANSIDLLNKPVTGTTHRIPLKVSKAGYTYEITYSALDFSGYTSTRKYYITVK